MPIEYCYRFLNTKEGGDIPPGQELEYDHQHIEPGGAIVLPNYINHEDDPNEVVIIS